jgi:antitoxin (DNA-binding transcriptional repressor) of toxin-antitoxin stability system
MIMTRLAASRAREDFTDTLKKVGEGERIVLHRGKKDVAAIVPLKDLRLLEQIEDRMDLDDARKALAASTKKREKPILWEKARRRLGL